MIFSNTAVILNAFLWLFHQLKLFKNVVDGVTVSFGDVQEGESSLLVLDFHG